MVVRIEFHVPEVDLIRVRFHVNLSPALAPSTGELMTEALRRSRPCHGGWEGKGGGALRPHAVKTLEKPTP